MTESDAPLVSVIIPAYNSLPDIFETLDSVLAQSMGDLEILIVDDGSTDGTAEAVDGYHAKIRVIRQSNQGIAGARNTGKAQARGRFYAFFDHDDVWHPGKLEAQLEVFANHPEVGVVSSSFLRWAGGEWPEAFLKPAVLDVEALVPRLSGYAFHEYVLDNQLFGTVLFRREVVEEVGDFDKALPPSDDWDYMIRASRVTQFAHLRDPTTLYRDHPNQTSRKLPDVNTRVLFRKRVLRRFGWQSPDGTKVNKKAFRAAQGRACLSFGSAHYKKGSATKALGAFFQAIAYQPWKINAYVYALLALPKCLKQTVIRS